jgi:arginase
VIVLDAPSNLGLRRPSPGVEPGARRLADALRGCGLVERLGAGDAGGVEAPP